MALSLPSKHSDTNTNFQGGLRLSGRRMHNIRTRREYHRLRIYWGCYYWASTSWMGASPTRKEFTKRKGRAGALILHRGTKRNDWRGGCLTLSPDESGIFLGGRYQRQLVLCSSFAWAKVAVPISTPFLLDTLERNVHVVAPAQPTIWLALFFTARPGSLTHSLSHSHERHEVDTRGSSEAIIISILTMSKVESKVWRLGLPGRDSLSHGDHPPPQTTAFPFPSRYRYFLRSPFP